MTRKPVPAKGAAAAAPSRAKAVSAPAKAARTTQISAAPGSVTKTTRSVPAKAAAAKAGIRAGAKTVAPKVAGKPAAKGAKSPGKSAVKVPVKTAVKAAPETAARAGKPAAKPLARSAASAPPAVGIRKAAKALVKAGKESPPAGRARTNEAPPQDAARPTLVRDSFTMPDGEYAVLANVKQACLKAGFEIKKSELLRIGVALVGRLDITTLRQVLGSLPQLKTGRPPSR